MKKVIWLFISCLMALSLVMASCGPKEEKKEEVGKEEVTVTEEKPTEEKPAEEEEVVEEGLLSPEVPKYGGTLTWVSSSDIGGWDPSYIRTQSCPAFYEIGDELIKPDWGKGPAGTNECSWIYGAVVRIDLMKGDLAESWELPDDTTIIAHIRKGVHWALDPQNEASKLVGGREFDAYDVVWSLERAYETEMTYFSQTYPVGQRPESYKALDKYTVEIKVPATTQGRMIWMCLGFTWMLPKEVADKYGDFRDWRNLVCTGPFMLRDYLPGSSVTYVRNPNYWDVDPIHPENQLPYVDKQKELIIADESTRLAAFRTGQVDYMTAVSSESVALLKSQCPGIEYVTEVSQPGVLWGRVDKSELPFKDIRVRQALCLAVDKQELVDTYYDGEAVMLGIPWPPGPAHSHIYTPLEEQPESVKELFTYNPEKARQLLADAGYPEGFKTEIICTGAQNADFLAIIKGYFDAIGVDMEIKVLETGVFNNLNRAHTYDQMIYRAIVDYGNPTNLNMCRTAGMDNPSRISLDWVMDAYDELQQIVGKDDKRVAEIIKPLGPRMLETACGVWLPAPYRYTLWWPWLQNFYGVTSLGYGWQHFERQYFWVDTALKKSMGY